MKISWHIEDDDVQKVKAVYESHQDNSFVRNRIHRNVGGNIPQVTEEIFWEAHVAALLTTQQRSGPNKPVTKFIAAKPFPLSLEKCRQSHNLRQMIQTMISEFGGIRRGPTIAKECEENLTWLTNGGWQQCFQLTQQLFNARDASTERRVAEFVDESLKGFGPKQARNVLQALGLTKYEIPIDSRITKWLNRNNFPIKLAAGPLSDPAYYNFVMDGIMDLCAAAEVLPCVMDAAIFSSYDPDWPDEQLVW